MSTDPWAAYEQPAADEALRLRLKPGRDAVRPVYEQVCQLLEARQLPTDVIEVSQRVDKYDVTIRVGPRSQREVSNADLRAHLDQIVAKALRVMFLDNGHGRTEYASSAPQGGSVSVYVHHMSFNQDPVERTGPGLAVAALAG